MKKRIQILSIISSSCLAALLLAVFFGFSENKDFSLSRKAAAASLIKTVYSGGESGVESSDDLLLIGEVVQTKYGTQAPSVSFQGNLAAIEEGRIDLNDRSFDVTRGSFYWSTATDPESTEPSQAYFGAENTFRLDGEEIVPNFYVPRALELEFENGRDLEFDRAEGIRFRWNTDERNEHPLIVVLQYIPEEGEELLTKQFTFTDGEQAAEITAEDLNEFPSDAKLILYAGRGNGKIVPIRGRETSLAGLTITSVPGIVLR